MGLFQQYSTARNEKDSVLCIGLDPAVSTQREENVIPEQFQDDQIEFCKHIIQKTAEHACCYKINSQYMLFNHRTDEIKELTDLIRKKGSLSILDHKLGDIGPSNQSAVYWIKQMGFDAFTYNPFAGNIPEASQSAHKNDLGIFVLTLMSNPEGAWIQKAKSGGQRLYEKIAYRSAKTNVDGLVVGSTAHVTEKDLQNIRNNSNGNAIFLCPGIGFQQGGIEKLKNNLGNNLLVNVGRGIIYHEEPAKKASEYHEKLRQ